MAESPPRPEQGPLHQLEMVADLLETPPLARVYAHVLQHGPVTVSDLIETLGIPQGTAYDYVQRLETADLIEKASEKRPYEYDAEPLSLTLSTDGETRTVTPSLVAAVARRDDDEDIDAFVDRHGLDGLAAALDYAFEYVEGTVNHRITARELGLSSLEAEIILQALEPLAQTYDSSG